MHSLQIIQTWPFSPAAMFTAIRHSGSVAWPACRRSPKSMSFYKPNTDYKKPSTVYNKPSTDYNKPTRDYNKKTTESISYFLVSLLHYA